ncbi:Putative Copper-dependent polysaccharide monooxygenases (Fragment) [Aspergillus calidoustus]|uniref:AA9 family lytic polysaccharide monooxygenase n=1 Tax=Aspergillus calidoustus TaxID=454130 RepID=A0A0U5GEY5_ASPCI
MSRIYLSFASLLATAAAHGHVTNIVVNGVYYAGWDINSYPYMETPPVVAAWGTPNTGGGPMDVSSGYTNPDLICSLNATNAQGHVTVAAGDKINLQWTEWPDTHHGPVIDYLASCNGACETVDKTTLEFFKIDGVGLVDNSAVPGVWGDDQLIENNNSWMVQIPESIAPGNYVLRHEIIALHSAGTEGGAQNYPQCFNLQITGSGTDEPTGTLGTELYTLDEAGILVNIYASLDSYEVPGPALYSGASSIAQATSAITATGTAETGTGGATATATASATESATATATATSSATSTFSTSSIRSSASVPSNPSTTSTATSVQTTQSATTVTTTTRTTSAPGTLTTATSSATSTTVSAPTTAPTTSTPPSSGEGGAQAIYQQCGGINYKGATACAEGSSCHKYNPYYSQCIPA